jgi:hypothetical protein
MLMLVRVRVEQLSASRTDAFHFRGIVHRQAAAFVEFACVAVYVLTAGFIHVEPDHLLADWTLGHERVEPPSAQELDELNHPYR